MIKIDLKGKTRYVDSFSINYPHNWNFVLGTIKVIERDINHGMLVLESPDWLKLKIAGILLLPLSADLTPWDVFEVLDYMEDVKNLLEDMEIVVTQGKDDV